MRNNLGGTYCLANHINASGIANFVPVGTSSAPFTGKLFGNNRVIRNLQINSAVDDTGLFGAVEDAVVQDLGLVNVNVTGPSNYVGALAGYASGATAISRVYVTGRVRCTATCNTVGGLIGETDGAAVDDSWSSAVVVADSSFGAVGGLVGHVGGDRVARSFAIGSVIATGSHWAGGLAGTIGIGGIVTLSYATGPVSSGDGGRVGGLAGASFGTLEKSFAAGRARGGVSAKVGGLVGYQDRGTVTESYSVGAVGGGASAVLGGLVAEQIAGATVSNSYWDTNTSGLTASAGGTGTTTVQLRSSLPAGFGNAWAITGKLSYPFLNDFDIDFASPLATLVRGGQVFTFLPIPQFDKSQYGTAPAHADAASLAAVYTMIARAIGITKNIAKLKNVKIDEYFWNDATQTATFKGPVKDNATLGPLGAIAGGAPLDENNVIGRMDQQELVILRGSTSKPGGGTAQHWMLGTLYTKAGGKVAAVVANDPWTGEQVMIDPATKKVLSPADFPLANFKVNGYRRVTVN